MRIVRFSLRQARREWRAGELRALSMALIVAVAALAAVGAFTERVEAGLIASSHELLGADLVVRSRQLPTADWSEEAQRRQLQTATTVSFPTVVFAQQRSLLAQVKAVTPGYPLRGRLELADAPFAAARPTTQIPQPGQVWIDARVASELKLGVGQSLDLGELTVTVAAILAFEPDRGNGLFSLAPRVMMNAEDLPAAALLGAGSRVRYRLMIAGQADAVAAFKAWLEPRLEPGQFFQTLADSQQQITAALERAQRFLGLAALTALILAGVAIVIAVQQFVQRHLDTVAMLACLGARRSAILASFALQLMWLAIPAVAIGCILGYLAQQGLIWAMGDLIPEQLPAPGVAAAAIAAATGIVALFGYGLLPLLRLHQVPPMRVLNRHLGHISSGHWLRYIVPGAVSFALIWWQAGELRLALYLSAGLCATLLVLMICAWLLIRLLRRLGNSGGTAWRFGLANVAKHSRASLMQIAGLGLGLMVMLVLATVQGDLLRGWRDTLPEKTPNYFLINIQPDQSEAVTTYLDIQNAATEGLAPMAVGRLRAINGRQPRAEDFADPRAQGRLRRSLNLSWSQQLPAGNRIVAGQWWDPDSEVAQVSLASTWADWFDLQPGDRVSFTVGAEEISAEVANIREVQWDSFQVNFFILLSPAAIGQIASTYLASIYLPSDRFQVVSDLVRRYPNISVVDVGAILKRVRSMIDQVTLTVQFVFAFTLLAGITVLIATLNAGLSERIYEGAVLRTLGGSKAQLRNAVLAEFALLGGVAGLLAAVAANAIGWLIAQQVFHIAYQIDWWLPLIGASGGAIAVALIGLYSGRRVLNTPPMRLLRGEP